MPGLSLGYAEARRRPAAEVREEVLQAAGELLLEEGMAAFTIEEAMS
jgi:AcrR family transcriptional regulator